MTGTRHVLLDADDPVRLAEYERDFYLAYAGLGDNRLVRRIWEWDHGARRVRTRVPYPDQVIYCRRSATGRLDGAMAVNLSPDRMLQSAAFGFALPEPPEHGGRACEILSVMRSPGPQWTPRTYPDFIREFVFQDLLLRGFDTAYATCTRRRLRSYLALGAQLRDRSRIEGEERFFLRWPLGTLVDQARRPRPYRLFGAPTQVARPLREAAPPRA